MEIIVQRLASEDGGTPVDVERDDICTPQTCEPNLSRGRRNMQDSLKEGLIELIEKAGEETKLKEKTKWILELKRYTKLPLRVAYGLVWDYQRYLLLPQDQQEAMLEKDWYTFDNVLEAYNNCFFDIVPAEFYSDERFLEATGITELPDFFCQNDQELRQFTISKKITRIGEYAFYGCSNLKQVVFEGRKKPLSIGNSAFRGCMGLRRLNIDQCIRLAEYCFAGSGLEEIIINGDVLEIPRKAFIDCAKLRTVNAPYGIAIGDEAFKNCKSLERIENPCGSIGVEAFRRCVRIDKLESGATRIDDWAFCDCKNLKELYLADYPYVIGIDIFKGIPEAPIVYSDNDVKGNAEFIEFLKQFAVPEDSPEYAELLEELHKIEEEDRLELEARKREEEQEDEDE